MATFTNVATLTYNGNTTNSNVVTGEILSVLSGNKTAVIDSYATGDDITYVINIINNGNTNITGLTVTDNLGSYTVDGVTVVPLDYIAGSVKYFVNGVLQTAPTVNAGPPLVFSGINVPAQSTATIVYEVQTNEFAPLGADGLITNEAVISGEGLNPVTVSETVTTRDEIDLSITKSLSPVVVNENGEITYTFTIQNFGNQPAEATDNVTLSDNFDPVLNISSVTFNGTPWTENVEYTYNAVTGAFATAAGQITVPAATFVQNPDGSFTVIPGTSTLTVVGTI